MGLPVGPELPPADAVSGEAAEFLRQHANVSHLVAAGGPLGLNQANALVGDVERWVWAVRGALPYLLWTDNPALVGPYVPSGPLGFDARIWFEVCGGLLVVRYRHPDAPQDSFRAWKTFSGPLRRRYFPCLAPAIVDFDVHLTRLALAADL